MKNIFLAFSVLLSSYLHAQYYYNDIIGAQETNRMMKAFIANKVRTVTATGYDPQGGRATDFTELQEVKENGKALKVSTITNLNKTIIYSRFDNMGRVVNVSDSSTDIQSITTYEYNAAGQITRVQNITRDTANDFNQSEVHQWLYNAAGKPTHMWRIISSTGNSIDSLEVRFVADQDGNAGEERTYRGGIEASYLYYYYDDKNRMSDIVRYNSKVKKLLPDLMFEYDDNDRVIQKITTTSSIDLNYLIWRYLFDANGLKTKEALFNSKKELTGKIEYSYVFGQ